LYIISALGWLYYISGTLSGRPSVGLILNSKSSRRCYVDREISRLVTTPCRVGNVQLFEYLFNFYCVATQHYILLYNMSEEKVADKIEEKITYSSVKEAGVAADRGRRRKMEVIFVVYK